jgi:hypothetical protein
MGFTDHPQAMIAALGPPRFALQPLGFHHALEQAVKPMIARAGVA